MQIHIPEQIISTLKAGSKYSSLLKAFHLIGEMFVDSVNEDAYIDIALKQE